MLRITKTFDNQESIILRLDGRVDSTTSSDLEEQCAQYRNGGSRTLLLDLSGVTFISQSGLKLLRKIKAEGIKLANGSLFVEALLGELKD